MSIRTTFTTISPLPAGVQRRAVLETLHEHGSMIDLNPLVRSRHRLGSAPAHAPADERSGGVWWEITDAVEFLPAGLWTGEVTYTCSFRDLPDGLRTHCFAPLATDIRGRWSVGGGGGGGGGSLPGETVESGLGPPQGLYLREDLELVCNFLLASFTKRTMVKAHEALVRRLVDKALQASTSDA